MFKTGSPNLNKLLPNGGFPTGGLSLITSDELKDEDNDVNLSLLLLSVAKCAGRKQVHVHYLDCLRLYEKSRATKGIPNLQMYWPESLDDCLDLALAAVETVGNSVNLVVLDSPNALPAKRGRIVSLVGKATNWLAKTKSLLSRYPKTGVVIGLGPIGDYNHLIENEAIVALSLSAGGHIRVHKPKQGVCRILATERGLKDLLIEPTPIARSRYDLI